jgi:DNA invertase Pin-like site-specific DNA recombinase
MSQVPNQTAATDEPPKPRCAIYARYSSEAQRRTSIEDQIRNCRSAAEKNGWVVLDQYIRSDAELTGRTIVGREGLAELIRLAKTKPRPFDFILVDDTSRFGRYLPDVLRESDMLAHYGVSLYFVSDRLDSRDEAFRFAYIIKGIGDEQYVRGLSQKVHRGQEGCIRRGYAAGGTCYGYKNRSIPDPGQSGRGSTIRTLGVMMEIIPEEAEVVRRIMQMRAEGMGFGTICKILNAESVTAPKRKYKGRISQRWYPSTIKEICRNEIYHGVRIWNRTQRVFNSADGTKIKRKRPQSEWVRVKLPNLRIISDELWERVHAVNEHNRDKIYGRRIGGLNRTESSRSYLFSGIMRCGLCDGPFTVVGGKLPKVFYGCRNHRYRHSCSARTTIQRERLEHQLIAAISANLLDPRLEEERTREFTAQLKARLELEEQLAGEAELNRPALEQERSELEIQARHLVDAIARHGISSFLSAQLETVEARLGDIERRLSAKPKAKLPSFTDEQIREFLDRESKDFCEVLAGDPELARRELQKRIKNLVITPKETPDRTTLEVTGDVELIRGADVLLGSSLDGTSQQYIGTSISLVGIVLNPAAPGISLRIGLRGCQ